MKSKKLVLLMFIAIHPIFNSVKSSLLTILTSFVRRSLDWMLHDRNMNSKINRMHKEALRIAYKDNVSSFENLLLMDN